MSHAAARVSGETPAVDVPLYGQLLEWATWATGRRVFVARHDEIALCFSAPPAFSEQLKRARRQGLTPRFEAIEKAIAALRNHETPFIHLVTIEYFLRWKTVEKISIERALSEHHVLGYLSRALRLLSGSVPEIERGLRP